MLRNVFTKTLWDMRRGLLAATIGVTAVGVLYAAFFPMINTPAMRDAMAMFPPEFLEALGITDMTSPAGYLDSTTFGLLGPILVIVVAAAIGASAIAGEEEGGRLDLLLAHPVSRWSVLLQRFGAMVLGLLLICAVLGTVLVLVAGLVQLDEIGAANFAAAATQLALLGVFFGSVALAVGAATGRRALAFAAVAVIGVITFFGNNLGPMVDWLAWLRDISPFHYYSGGEPLRNGLQPLDAAILAGSAMVLVLLGGLAFDRRDISV